MSTLTTPPAAPGAGVSLLSRSLPRWAPAATLAGSAAVVAAVLVAVGAFGLAQWTVLSVLLFAVTITAASASVEGGRRAKDRLVTTLVYVCFGLAMIPLVSVLWTTVQNGVLRLDPYFLQTSMRNVLARDDAGGAYHAIMGTLIVTGWATVISVPVGLMTAIYLVEYGRGRLAQAITFFVDVMTGIPSIVAGLFIAALWLQLFGAGNFMGFAGSCALSVLMIPVVVRSSEEMLKLVPNELREASYALGVPKWRTIVKVVLPTSIAGVTTGVMIAIARIIGETAPLLVTAGFTDSINFNAFDSRMITLPVYVYRQISQGGQIPFERAWAAALTLIVIVMALNLLARLVSRIFAPRTGR
ncbi:phosphate ABC transporter permease PstA [Allonocardiopsis opalescens]|uniref:Phosphate transport system permease protein PstA n=1 Tax=Allonocardiopsis opalescens TaxID=1144618 RepID=A0A2T0QA76_9ACTN|nr:phosphate ABC transporter permease PstA [Allonocardiopsis opalescens]PRY00788.1 phosphate ABC transporter membrane protein 2 (PhoT family) [Allonocardiopsis opalescens]